MTLTTRQLFLLGAIQVGTMTCRVLNNNTRNGRTWRIDRVGGSYPRGKRQPSDREMTALFFSSTIFLKKNPDGPGSIVKLTAKGRKTITATRGQE